MLVSGLVTYHDSLAPFLIPIDAVQQHPENYNNGDVDAIAASIEVNGMYRPVYVQKSTRYIVAGNSTWHACKMLDATEIPVVVLDIDDHAAKKMMVADNRTAALARPDDAALLKLLDQIAVEDGLDGTGYTEESVEALRLLQEKLAATPMGYPAIHPDPNATVECPSCGFTWNTTVL